MLSNKRHDQRKSKEEESKNEKMKQESLVSNLKEDIQRLWEQVNELEKDKAEADRNKNILAQLIEANVIDADVSLAS